MSYVQYLQQISLHVPSLTPSSLSRQRHNNQRARGYDPHGGTQRQCSLCAVLGSGRHKPTLMRRHQRVAREAWRVRATSGLYTLVGASEPALPRSLRLPRSLLLRDVVFIWWCCFFQPPLNHNAVAEASTATATHAAPPPPYCCCCCCCAAAVALRLLLVYLAFVSIN